MFAVSRNAEICGCAAKTSKSTGNPYLVISFIDESGNYGQLMDRNMKHHALLERGMRVDLVLKITTYNRTTYVSVEDIVLHPTDESTNDDQ